MPMLAVGYSSSPLSSFQSASDAAEGIACALLQLLQHPALIWHLRQPHRGAEEPAQHRLQPGAAEDGWSGEGHEVAQATEQAEDFTRDVRAIADDRRNEGAHSRQHDNKPKEGRTGCHRPQALLGNPLDPPRSGYGEQGCVDREYHEIEHGRKNKNIPRTAKSGERLNGEDRKTGFTNAQYDQGDVRQRVDQPEEQIGHRNQDDLDRGRDERRRRLVEMIENQRRQNDVGGRAEEERRLELSTMRTPDRSGHNNEEDEKKECITYELDELPNRHGVCLATLFTMRIGLRVRTQSRRRDLFRLPQHNGRVSV